MRIDLHLATAAGTAEACWGYAALLHTPGKQRGLSGVVSPGSQRQALLMAAEAGMSALTRPCDVVLHLADEALAKLLGEVVRRQGPPADSDEPAALWSSLIGFTFRHQIQIAPATAESHPQALEAAEAALAKEALFAQNPLHLDLGVATSGQALGWAGRWQDGAPAPCGADGSGGGEMLGELTALVRALESREGDFLVHLRCASEDLDGELRRRLAAGRSAFGDAPLWSRLEQALQRYRLTLHPPQSEGAAAGRARSALEHWLFFQDPARSAPASLP